MMEHLVTVLRVTGLYVLAVLLLLINVSPRADAKEQKQPFPTKPITMIVLTSPGGGWDTVSRVAAENWRPFLPNNVPIVIKNIPGGEQLIGPTTLYNSPPDGYTIGTVSSGSTGAIVAGVVRFDVKKFEWVGILSDDYYIVSASPKSGFKQLSDLQKSKKEILVGTPGFATTDAMGALLSKEKMKLNLKMIPHDGSSGAALAAIRGDVDLVSSPVSSMKKFVVDGHDLVPLWTSAPERLKRLPNVPTLKELGYPEVGKMYSLHRLVAAPPGTPADRLEILRKSFRAMLENPKYQARVKGDFDAEINLAQGQEVGRIVEELISLLKPYETIVKAGWGKK
jgi:putative tricarboxylic transport membrane protein